MYIDKWWEECCGGTDDAMLLIDYFDENHKTTFSFSEIIKDLHLDNVLGKKAFYESRAEAGYYLTVLDNGNTLRCDFDLISDVVIDLGALVLQSLVEKTVTVVSYNRIPAKTISFSIAADREDIKLLTTEIEDIVNHPQLYYPDFLQNEFLECVDGIQEMLAELKTYG